MRPHFSFRHLHGIAFAILLASIGDASAQGFKFLEVKVLDPDGKPMTDVAVEISLNGMSFPMPTNDKGMVSLNVPSGGDSRVAVAVKHDGYLAQGASWEPGESVPTEFTFPMKKGVPIGGIVHDEEGQPIEGVKIEGIMIFQNNTQLPGKGKLQPYFNGELATTDKDGRWRVNSAPEEKLELQLKFSHPEYVSDQGYGFRGGTWEELRSLEKIVVLEKGLGIGGTVVNADGKPINGAKVGLGGDYVNDDMITRTDADGKYRLNNVQAGNNMLTVFATGHSPDLRNVAIVRDMEAVDFKLEPGHKVTFKVVDPDGKPVPGVGIAADTWRNTRSLMTMADRGSTDAEGLWSWESAPADEVQVDMFCRGYMSVRGQKFAPREEPYEITMPKALKVTGKVVDAESGEPIKQFQVIEGLRFNSINEGPHWQRHNDQAGSDGSYIKEFGEPYEGYLIRIEAEGYRPGVSRLIKSDEGEASVDFKLEKGTGPTGIVKGADGKPVAGAEVLMTSSGRNQLSISNGRNQRQSDTIQTVSDDSGKFTLPFADADLKVVCLSDAGWGELDATAESDNLEIVLEPWSKLEGVVMRGKKPLANKQVNLNYQQENYQRNRPQAYWSYGVATDAAGKFVLDRVRSGSFNPGLMVPYADTGRGGMMSTNSHTEFVELKPGETATVQLGGKGRHIKGQMTVPEGFAGKVSWKMGAVQIYEQTATPNAQGVFHALGRALAQATNHVPAAKQTPAAQFRRSYSAAFDDQGNFEIFDVQPGSYQLSVTIYELPGAQQNWNPVGNLNQTLTVPEGAEGDVVDLGKFELKMVQPAPPVQASGVTGTFRLTPVLPQPAE
ncbi:MAG: carboxypeptidase regulatory-like domain-containing protein [Bythopirellula sp.]|nr:carboxypeptidase regulatory-like domain-containing protein [Bythopirellula sp.]